MQQHSHRREALMGGMGSGRWGGHRKALTVEEVPLKLALDRHVAASIRAGGRYGVRWTHQPGLAEPGVEHTIAYTVCTDHAAVMLDYTADGQRIVERVGITPARLTYGQQLYWRCPGCGRRVGILYHLGRFRCRTCHRLTYRSTQQTDKRVYAYLREVGDQASPAALLARRGDDTNQTILLLKASGIVSARQRRAFRRR
jgi:DNA-directed RNA polymerase subunit RPC12/RpoP